MVSSIPKWLGDLFESSLRPNMTVMAISFLSPQIKRVRLRGDLSKMNFQVGYACVVRVSETEYRNYTVAYYDMKESTLDIIFHIHNKGGGSRYVENLETGDTIYVSEPRGKKLYDPAIKQQLVFGDETSLGLACSFLPFLKQNQQQYRFYFELAEENKDVPGLLGLENWTVFPKHGLFRNEKWINDLPFFKSPGWATAAFALTGNVNSVQAFRKVLKNNTKGKIFSQGYWLEGKKGL